MSMAALAPAARRRALDLLGIQRYRLRGTEPIAAELPAAPAVVEAAQPAPASDSPPRVRYSQRAEPPAAPRPALRDPPPLELGPVNARITFVLDADAIAESPWSGRYARLLAQLAAALGIARNQVGFDSAKTGLQRVYFGATPGDDADAILAPPLASLRASPAAKRALWREWRRLRRTLA